MKIKINLRIKLMAMFFLISSISVVVLGITAYIIGTRTMQEKVSEGIDTTAAQVAFSVGVEVEKIENLMDFIFTDDEIQRLLTQKESLADASTYKKINKIIDSYFINTDELVACSIIDSKGGRYYYKRNIYDKDLETEWYDRAVEGDGRIVWIGPVSLPELEPWTSKALVVTRSLKNLDDSDVIHSIGVITLFFADRLLANISNSVGDGNLLLIVDEKNRILSAGGSDMALAGAALEYASAHLSDSGAPPADVTLSGERCMMPVRAVPSSGWLVLEVVPYSAISGNFQFITLLTLLISALNLIAVLLLSLYFSKKIASPLRELGAEMDKVSEGDFEVKQFPPERTDEVGQLQRGFNEMVDRMNVLFCTTIEKEKEKQLEELKALQYQINPHFLYNTLNSVRLMALMSKSDNIAKALDSLIRLLRTASGKTGALVPLREEVSIIGDYVNIHQIRYQRQIALQNEISEEHMALLVPSFLLQPLVENALFHGLEPQTGDGRITLRAAVEGDKLTVTVEDNGTGMPPESIRQAMSGQAENSKAFVKIGIKNVNDRIKLTFGGDYGLKLASAVGKGTRVTITLPVLKGEAQHEDHDRG